MATRITGRLEPFVNHTYNDSVPGSRAPSRTVLEEERNEVVYDLGRTEPVPMDTEQAGFYDNMRQRPMSQGVKNQHPASQDNQVGEPPTVVLKEDEEGYLLTREALAHLNQRPLSHRYEQMDMSRHATVLADPNRPLYFAGFLDFEKDLHTLVKAMRPSKIFSILCCGGSSYAKETHIITRLISLTAVKFSAQIIDENNQDNNTKAFRERMREIVTHIFPDVDKEDTTSVDMDKLSNWVERAFITYVENRISSMRGSMCFPDAATLNQFLSDNKAFKAVIKRGTNYEESLRNVITLAALRFAGMKIEEAQVRKKTMEIISELQPQNANPAVWRNISTDLIKALMSCKNRTWQNGTVC